MVGDPCHLTYIFFYILKHKNATNYHWLVEVWGAYDKKDVKNNVCTMPKFTFKYLQKLGYTYSETMSRDTFVFPSPFTTTLGQLVILAAPLPGMVSRIIWMAF